MQNLREYLRENKIDISLEYYGVHDFATQWEAKNIIDNTKVFDDLFIRFPISELANLNDFYVYLFYCKLAAMDEIIPLLINDKDKLFLSTLSKNAKSAIDIIQVGDVIRFINIHHQDIFVAEPTSHDMIFITIDIIAKYINGIRREVFELLSKHYGIHIVNRFEQFEKMFEQHPDLFSIIYSTGHLEEAESYGLETTLNIWYRIHNKERSSLKATIVKLINVLYEDVKGLSELAMNNNTTRDIMIVENIVRKFYLFLQRIQNPKANEFARYANATAELLSKSITESGQSFDYEIPVDEIISKWKTIDKWQLRMLCMTHKLKTEGDSFTCISQMSIEPGNRHWLIDDCSTNIPTDDYFTMSHQQTLSVLASVGTGTMIGIIRERDLFRDYLNLVTSALIVITKHIKAEGEQLDQDMKMLSAMLQLFVNNTDMDKNAVNGMCYGATMFMCALAEKLLRLLYVYVVKDEKYIPIKKATLGEMLAVQNPYMVNIFGENHIRHLSFYLQQTPISNVGYNYRNGLAHWIDMSPSELTTVFFAEMLWLFTDIVNTVFWYCIEDSKEKSKEQKIE